MKTWIGRKVLLRDWDDYYPPPPGMAASNIPMFENESTGDEFRKDIVAQLEGWLEVSGVPV